MFTSLKMFNIQIDYYAYAEARCSLDPFNTLKCTKTDVIGFKALK